MKKKYDRLSVKKKRYYRITAVIIISFGLFELVSNFTYILYGRAKQESLSQLDNVDYKVIMNALEENVPENYYLEETVQESEVVIVGDIEDETVKYISQELRYLKKYYSIIDDISNIETGLKPEIIILSKESYSLEEQVIIDSFVETGVNLIFTRLPQTSIVESDWGKNIFSVKNINGIKTYEGLRIISDFFIGDLVELHDMKVILTDVDLSSGCKIYAYSLMDLFNEKNIDSVPVFELGENEEMPPLIWRYIKGESEVFVVNGDFMEGTVACGVINSIISEMSEVYLYPVINSNSLFILGLPYTKNINTSKMQSLYSRDALGVQQDLIFPGIINITSKYNLFPGYYTENYDELNSNITDRQLQYYMKELTKQTAALGLINEDGECVTLSPNKKVDSILANWGSDFLFYDRKEAYVNIPKIIDDVHTTDYDILKATSSVSSLGYLSDIVDIRVVLDPQTEDDEWVNFEKDFATMESFQNFKFGYLEKLNTEDTIKRIILFEMLEPEIQYNTGKIKVESKNFYGEANYILRTEYEIEQIKGGTYTKIGNKAYLISQKEESMTIEYSEEIK